MNAVIVSATLARELMLWASLLACNWPRPSFSGREPAPCYWRCRGSLDSKTGSRAALPSGEAFEAGEEDPDLLVAAQGRDPTLA